MVDLVWRFSLTPGGGSSARKRTQDLTDTGSPLRQTHSLDGLGSTEYVLVYEYIAKASVPDSVTPAQTREIAREAYVYGFPMVDS